MMDTHTKFETKAIKLATTAWHIYEDLGSEESDNEDCAERPYVGFLYNYEPRTDRYFSVMRMSDLNTLMVQVNEGRKMEFGRFIHFDDRQIDQVNELLRLDYVHWDGCFMPDPFFVPFVHLVEFRNNEIAQAIALELLKRGCDIRPAAVYFLEGYSEYDIEDDVNEFVSRCEKIHEKIQFHSRLQDTLNINSGSRSLGSNKI